MIYEPDEDSLLIKKFIRNYAKGRVLDMGTGSGVLALEAMKYSKDVEACDISKSSVSFVREKGVNAYVSDLFSNVGGKFDLIIFNPPYLPLDLREDKESRVVTTGGEKGNEILERFLKDAKKFLNVHGKVLIVVSSLTPDVEKLLSKYDFKFEVLEKKKISFEELIVYLCY
jgi:release factor glutamine methyltransferase